MAHQCEYNPFISMVPLRINYKVNYVANHHYKANFIFGDNGEQYYIQEGDRKENYRELFGVTICNSALQLSYLHVIWVAFNQQRVG